MSKLVVAPFTQEQADALNRWQQAATVHPFTCPNNHQASRLLVARPGAGWVCPTCGYTQTWAHKMMLEQPPTSH